jgi:hypothetical protein
MIDVNVAKQFYFHKLKSGSIGALPGRHRDRTGITRSLIVVKSAMAGMDCDETVSSRVSTGINREYTGLASALPVYVRCYIGY